MKYTWETNDITAGRYICKKLAPANANADLGWHTKWTWKIGWLSGGNPERDYYDGLRQCHSPKEREDYLNKNRADYCFIAMSDGMIYQPMTKEEMAKALNENEMIPATQDHMIEILNYTKSFTD